MVGGRSQEEALPTSNVNEGFADFAAAVFELVQPIKM